METIKKKNQIRAALQNLAKTSLILAAFIATQAHSKDRGSAYAGEHGAESDSRLGNIAASCTKANAAQRAKVNLGNSKRDDFFKQCARDTRNSPWCKQLVRPNLSSVNTFRCTYGSNQPHQLIHPEEKTWGDAFQGVVLLEKLEERGIKVCGIYNWWRPEPYNKNVGGAAGRHPFGTSIDVRFCSKADQEKAFAELCHMRQHGELRAVGYYSSSALHIGVGDRTGNTWGKKCP